MATGITMAAFRWRNDDGSESSATWIAALNTNPSSTSVGTSNQKIRVRFQFNSGHAYTGLVYSLTCSHNGGSNVAVGASSTYVQGVVSSNLTNGANTTEQMGESGTYVAVPGVINNTSATQSTSFNSTLSTVFEIEFSLLLVASALSNSDTLSFQVVQNTGLLLQPTPGATLTISKSSGTSSRRRASVTLER